MSASDSSLSKPQGAGDGGSPSELAAAQAGAVPAREETFGQYLARERELRGFSLSQVAEATCIGAVNLKALESGDLKRLPARVYVVGYIRAYAQAIGLSADEAVLRFEEQSQVAGAVPERRARRGTRKRGIIGALIAVVLGLAAAGTAALLLAR